MRQKISGVLGPVVAQGIFGLGQMTVTLFGGLALAPDAWGRFAVLLTAFVLAGNFVRGFGAQPIVTFLSGMPDARATARAGTVVALLAAVPPQLALVGVAVALGIPVTGVLLAVSLSAYCAYDLARSVELAGDERRRLLLADGVLLALLVAGSASSLLHHADAAIVIPVGMTIAYTAALTTLRLGRSHAPQWSVQRFVSVFRRDIPFLAFDGLVLSMSMGAVVFVLGAFASLEDAGAFRSALTLVAGPLQMLLAGLTPLVIRQLRQRAEAAPGKRSHRFPLGVALGGIVFGAAWGALGMVVCLLIDPLIGSGAAGLARFAIASSALVSTVWACSVLSMYQRYRRPAVELSIVRVLSVGMTVAALVVTVPVMTDSVVAVFVATLLAVLAPAAHLAFARGSRRSPVISTAA